MYGRAWRAAISISIAIYISEERAVSVAVLSGNRSRSKSHALLRPCDHVTIRNERRVISHLVHPLSDDRAPFRAVHSGVSESLIAQQR